MTQYLLNPKTGIHQLKYALEKYSRNRFVISGFSLGQKKSMHAISLSKKDLEHLTLDINDQWIFRWSSDQHVTITPDELNIFKIEYQNETYKRIHPHCIDPNASTMPHVSYTAFRNVVDEYLVEVFFEGKISLTEDKQYFKLKEYNKNI